jgi:hypothetical protein
VPVNRLLPPKLLIKVLEYRKEQEVKDPVVVAAGVCRRWRQILTSVPHLWTKIKFGPCPIEVTSKRLEWSKKELIDVTFPEPGWKHFDNELLGANPWIARTKSLTIKRDIEHLKKIFGTLHSAAPKLESLIIEGVHHRSNAYYTDSTSRGNFMSSHKFLGRFTPSLQSITFRDVLPGMAFTFPLPVLTKIDWVAPTAYVGFDEILNLLSTSPLLEDITVHAKVRLQDRSNKRRVTLGELRHLDWNDYEGSTSLVPHLIAPKLKGLRIQVIHKDRNQTTTLASILSSGQNDIGLFHIEPVAVDYSYGPSRRSWCFRYTDPEISDLWVEVEGEKQDPDIDWSLAGLPISLSSTKSLTVQWSGAGKSPLGKIPFKKLRRLKSLTMQGEIDSLIPLIELVRQDGKKSVHFSHLLELFHSPFGKDPAPFPHLSELRIDLRDSRSVPSTLGKLTEVLKERKRGKHRVSKVQFFLSSDQHKEITDFTKIKSAVKDVHWSEDGFI